MISRKIYRFCSIPIINNNPLRQGLKGAAVATVRDYTGIILYINREQPDHSPTGKVPQPLETITDK